ncbi:hypothetical protein [Streptomyces griseocarneus]|uniref:hypothetical protein n=1 Tax=Streptomyces griseocarneus TaxID=51201 RepID=UPI00167E02C7|nr:hypothetical protein [Streptomyces griseocarneus]MBZ6476472.1 hypothetical protein [Streptomyces griseocarneus]GHG78718.1 hypothetical protein GCM10018779_58820 [Streptomyces griseocarneus]
MNAADADSESGPVDAHDAGAEQTDDAPEPAAAEDSQETAEESEATEGGDDEDDTERKAETDAKIAEFESQGHGPQRHLHPSTEALKARKGEPKADDNGNVKFKGNGHVETKRHVNPETGRFNDVKANGGTRPHGCGDYATKFDNAEDYVKAEQYLRQKAEQTGKPKVNATIEEIFGPGDHSDKFEGYYVDPANPKNEDGTVNHLLVDFRKGRIIAEFNESAGGLHAMYPDPRAGRQP